MDNWKLINYLAALAVLYVVFYAEWNIPEWMIPVLTYGLLISFAVKIGFNVYRKRYGQVAVNVIALVLLVYLFLVASP